MLACLVAVTGCCPFIDPLWAILIGGMLTNLLDLSACGQNSIDCPSSFTPVLTVFFYHAGCWLVHVLNLQDGARIFPVHAIRWGN